MSDTEKMWELVDKTILEVIEAQHRTLMSYGRRIVPTLTSEDLLQPNDYPELDNHPHFRYEEGVLAGMQTLRFALSALHRDELSD